MKQQSQLALEAIRKKLVGKKLNYKEIYAIMDQIANDRLGDILTTYFAASGYTKGFNNEELYYLTKAMVETGEKLTFRGIIADKHSIGGMPGTRTTLIVVPIVVAAGFKIPKSSSRAITTPGGTADVMEVLAPVVFTKEKIYKIVGKVGGCIVWGGMFNIAPADDEIIRVEEPLLFESYDKIIISIMAKKVAFGSNHVVIDVPYGQTMKVHREIDAQELKKKFEYVAKKFKMKIKIIIHKTEQPAGRGIGPLLEAREALRVLEHSHLHSLDLEERALDLTGSLLDLCLVSASQRRKKEVEKMYGSGKVWARHLLESGEALAKFKEIIKAQGGNPNVTSESLKPARFHMEIAAGRGGSIKTIDNRNVTIIGRVLGAPLVQNAGIYLNKKIGEEFVKGETILTLYSNSSHSLKEARETLTRMPIYRY